MEVLLCRAGDKEIKFSISKHVTGKKGNYLFLWELQSMVVVASDKSKLDVHSWKANWGHTDEKFSPFLIPPSFLYPPLWSLYHSWRENLGHLFLSFLPDCYFILIFGRVAMISSGCLDESLIDIPQGYSRKMHPSQDLFLKSQHEFETYTVCQQ